MTAPTDCRTCAHYSRDLGKSWCDRGDTLAILRGKASERIEPPEDCPLRQEKAKCQTIA